VTSTPIADLQKKQRDLELSVLAGVQVWKSKRYTVTEKDAGDFLAKAFDEFVAASEELEEAVDVALAELSKPGARP
jgi:hypothetical protein